MTTTDRSSPDPLVILLVEDSEVDVEVLHAAAIRSSHRPVVRAVRTGDAAIDHLRSRSEEVDLILLDLNLPGIDGFEVLTALRADPLTRHVPVVVLTSSSAAVDVERAHDLGARAHLLKPLGLAATIELLDDICGFWVRALRERPDPA